MEDKRQTLSAGIIKRFLQGKDFEEFIKKYNESRISYSYTSRKTNLEQPITADEQKAMKLYYGEIDQPVKYLATQMGVSVSKFTYWVVNGSRKTAYKNY